jgi:8-oxo-dGTP diphosphatase
MKTKYCLGFLFSQHGGPPVVALIKKNRPAWQAGKLNGIGGKVEEGELPSEAMRREFTEETGVEIDRWTPFAEMVFTDCTVFCFVAQDDDRIFEIHSMTDEKVRISNIHDTEGRLPNLAWLVPMAISALSDPRQGIIRLEHL